MKISNYLNSNIENDVNNQNTVINDMREDVTNINGLENTKEEKKMQQKEKPQFLLKKTGKGAPKKNKRMKSCTERNPPKKSNFGSISIL